jgi:hypothetical protein
VADFSQAKRLKDPNAPWKKLELQIPLLRRWKRRVLTGATARECHKIPHKSLHFLKNSGFWNPSPLPSTTFSLRPRRYASPRELAMHAHAGTKNFALNGILAKMLGRVEKR